MLAATTPAPNWLRQVAEPHIDLVGPSPVPYQFDGVTFDMLPTKGLKRVISAYGAKFWSEGAQGMAPLLIGPPGAFKSVSAAILSNQIRTKALVKTGWCTIPVDLTRLERARYAERTSEQIQEWINVPFLVIDDFAMVRLGSWQFDVMAEIAMSRFDARRPTMWTGNITLPGGNLDGVQKALTGSVGAQLTRRMLERSSGYRLYVGVHNAGTGTSP